MNEHDAIARIKRLSHSINCADEIAEVIERLIKERDEARRELCKALAMNPSADGTDSSNPIFHSVVRGWNCFEETTNG